MHVSKSVYQRGFCIQKLFLTIILLPITMYVSDYYADKLTLINVESF